MTKHVDTSSFRRGLSRTPIREPESSFLAFAGMTETEMNRAGYPDFDSFREAHRGWVEAEIERAGGGHQAHRTQSIAVGSSAFVETVQQRLSFRALGRRKRPLAWGMELREPVVPYNELSGPEKEVIEP